MAGQIGIRTNLTIDSKNLKDQIETIKKTLAKDNAFKINVAQESLTQLKELQALVKDITTMAGKGIKIKVDYNKVDKDSTTSGSPSKESDGETRELISNLEAIKSLTKEKGDILRTGKHEVDGILKEEYILFENQSKKMEKMTRKIGKDGTVTNITDIKTDYKAQEKAMADLRKAIVTTEKSYKSLSKISGESMPDMSKLTEDMSKLDKNGFDVDIVNRMRDSLLELGNAYKVAADKASSQNNSFDTAKTMEKSSQALTKMRTQYDQFKASYTNLDGDNKVLNQLTLVEQKMKEIQLSGEGKGTPAFKSMELETIKLTGLMDGLKTQVSLVTDKKSKIDTLQKSLRNLLTFEQNGTVTSEYIARIKNEIMAMDGIGDKTKLKEEFDRINASITETGTTAREATKSLKGMGNTSHGLKRLSDGLAKMGIYFSAWRLTSEIFQEIKRGIKIVSDLDNEIVQVGIDMNITAKESAQLMKEAQRIAVETGIGIQDVVRVAGVYSNETENMATVLAKVKPSAILAGIANASATEITDMFQGVVHQYKLATDDIEKLSYDISDSIIGVSKNMAQNFDTSVKELSEVMLDAGAVMSSLGYTYKETMAMAGSIMEVTRQSGSELGGALRMIGARIGGAKNTGEDVEIEEISKAAKAYKDVGIEIVNADGSFKDMKDTMRELNGIWGGLTDVQRSYIAEMSAGNRRRNTFMVMMDTMGKQTELTNIALNSQGDTLAANEKYLESTGAKMQLFTNAMDTLWQNTMSSDAIKSILEIGTGFVKIVDSIGIASAAIIAFTTYLIYSGKAGLLLAGLGNVFFNISLGAANAGRSVLSYGASMMWATLKTLAFNAVVIAGKIALTAGLSLAIAAVVSVLADLSKGYDESAKRSEKFKDAVSTATDELKKAKELQNSLSLNKSLLRGLDPDSEKAVEIKGKILDIEKQLAGVLPESASAFTKQGDAIAGSTEMVDDAIRAKERLIEVNALLFLQENGINNQAKMDAFEAEGKAIDEAIKSTEALLQAGEKTKKVFEKDKIGLFGVSNIELDNVQILNDELEKRQKHNEKAVEWNKMIDDTGNASLQNQKHAIIAYDDIENKLATIKGLTKDMGDNIYGAVRETKALDEALESSVSLMKDLDSIIEEINDKDFDGISESSLNVIIDKYPHLLQYIDDEKRLKEEIIALYDVEKQKSSDVLAVKLANMAQDGKTHFATMNSKLSNDKEWYRVNVLNNKELMSTFSNLYKIDLSNFNTLQQAKTEADRGYIKNATNNYNAFFNKLSNAYGEMARMADKNAADANKRLQRTGMLIETDYDGGTGWRNQFTGLSTYTQGLNAISWSGVNPSVGTGTGAAAKDKKDKNSGDDNVYESDKAFFNKHTALIEEYQRQLELLERKISKTTESIAYYKEIGSDSAMQNVLILQNRLYAEQTERLNLLNKAQSDMINNQRGIANSMSSMGINMSTQTAEDLNYWLDRLYPQIKSTNQAVVDAQNDKREAFERSWDSYMDYASELVSIESEIIGMQGELLSILKDKYETEFGIIEKRLSNFAKYTEDINRKLALLDDTASYNTRERLVSQSLSSLETYRKELESTLRTMNNQKNSLSMSSAEWTLINEKVIEYENTLHDTNSEILQTQKTLKSLRDDELNNSLSMLDKIAATVRKQYEEAKKMELEALKATMDAEVKVKRAELQILQDRLDAMNDTTADKEAELKALRDEAKMWENDNSVYAKRQLAELNKVIKEKERDIEKDRIQSEMDNLEKEITTIEEANQERVDSVEKTYEEMLSDQNVYQQASMILMNSSQEDVLNLLLSYDERYRGMGSILGKAFATGLMEEIIKGLDSFDSLSDGLMSSDKIPWLTSLPSGYSYDQSGGINANGLGAQSTVPQNISTDINGNPIDYSSMRALYDYTGATVAIENASINMNVNFYTNGQLDTERSIQSLGDMLTSSLVGSGSMLNINK